MIGAEYLTAAVLKALWQELDEAFAVELSESKCGVQDFLKRRNPAWNLVGRVHFNVAENRKDPDAPFAFLATYTTTALGAGQGATSAAGAGAARVRGRGKQGASFVTAGSGAAGVGNVSVAEGHGRCG